MAKVGKTNAGSVKADAPQLKSRGLKNPMPQNLELGQSPGEMAMGNDGAGKGQAGKAPKSGKRAPGKME